MNRTLYLRHFAIVFSGTAVAQLVNLCSYPFLARLYSPHDFGVFAIFVTWAAMFGAVSCGRFDLVVQSAKESELATAYLLSQVINIGVAIASALAFIAYASLAGSVDYLFAALLGIVVFLTGFTNASSLLLLRREQFKYRSLTVVVRTLLTAIPQIVLFWFLPTATGLMLGFCAGFCVQALMMRSVVRTITVNHGPSVRRCRALLRKYSAQVLVDIPSTLLSAAVQNLMPVLLLILYTAQIVGFYALAFRLAVVPLVVFSSALSEVFFQKAAKAYRAQGSFWPEMRFNLGTSMVFSAGILIGIATLSSIFVAIFLGKEWATSADIMLYLAPMLAVRFVSSSIQTMPLVVRKPQYLLFNNLGLLVAMGVAFWIGSAWELSVKNYLLFNTALMSLVHICFIVKIVVETKQKY